MVEMMVCVFGLWHLGSVTAACLASVGHQIVGLDFENDVVENLKDGKGPVFESGLDALLKEGLQAGRLLIFLLIQSNLWQRLMSYGSRMTHQSTKTIMQMLITCFSRSNTNCASLIALGSHDTDFFTIACWFHPAELEDFAIQFSKELTSTLLAPLKIFAWQCIKSISNQTGLWWESEMKGHSLTVLRVVRPITDRIEWMSIESAEMTKHAINSFLATSVAFANEIASICEMVGADAKEVEQGLKSESRIGPKAYLSPGAAFAGGTLARDIQFLNQLANDRGCKIPLLSSVRTSNDQHHNWVRRHLQNKFPNSQKNYCCLGPDLQAWNKTLRRSLSVELCNWLLDQVHFCRFMIH